MRKTVLYVENPKKPHLKNWKLINGFSRVAKYKVNIQKYLYFYIVTTNILKVKKIIIFLNYNYNIQLMGLLLNQLIKIDLVGGIKMETEEAPECPSSHRCTHTAIPLKEMQKSNWVTLLLQATKKIATSKWVGKTETHYFHKYYPWYSVIKF